VFTFAKKEIKKVQRLMQIHNEENYKSQHENASKLTDLRKTINDLQVQTQ